MRTAIQRENTLSNERGCVFLCQTRSRKKLVGRVGKQQRGKNSKTSFYWKFPMPRLKKRVKKGACGHWIGKANDSLLRNWSCWDIRPEQVLPNLNDVFPLVRLMGASRTRGLGQVSLSFVWFYSIRIALSKQKIQKVLHYVRSVLPTHIIRWYDYHLTK